MGFQKIAWGEHCPLKHVLMQINKYTKQNIQIVFRWEWCFFKALPFTVKIKEANNEM